MMIATAIPSVLRGSQPTSLAATGAITMPPIDRPSTASQLISNRQSEARNPRLAQTATMNSAAETVPITFRGSCSVVAKRVGVTTGPQPPPPEASTNPPVNPMNFKYLGSLTAVRLT